MKFFVLGKLFCAIRYSFFDVFKEGKVAALGPHFFWNYATQVFTISSPGPVTLQSSRKLLALSLFAPPVARYSAKLAEEGVD